MRNNTFVWAWLLVFVSLIYTSCKKNSVNSQDEIFMKASVDSQSLRTNRCAIYSTGNFWVIDGFSYKNDISGPPVYPRLQLFLWNYQFATGSFNISTDSVTAYYFPSETDTIQAINGTINVTKVYPDRCGGILGTFNITLKDGTAISNGTFASEPRCGTL